MSKHPYTPYIRDINDKKRRQSNRTPNFVKLMFVLTWMLLLVVFV